MVQKQFVIKEKSNTTEVILSCQGAKTLSGTTGVMSKFPKGRTSNWPIWDNLSYKRIMTVYLNKSNT